MGEAALLAGKYQTVRRLAVGGMGEVYLARESGRLGFSRLVVIKKLLPQFARDRHFVEMFVDEARIIGHLNHPNICQILELGDDDGTPFLALEYVRGESLAGIWDRAQEVGREIPRVVTLRILADTAWALHFAHEARDADGTPLNVIHRDISPHNVMVSFNGDVKLMDFGIARADNRQHRTDTGKIKGKISYMAPEQLRGTALDRRTDVFAVGVMLWELTLSKRLFGGGNEVETLQKAVSCLVPTPRSIEPTYPKELEAIAMASLAAEREQRTSTAGALATALADQVAALGGCERGDVAAILRQLFPAETATAEDMPKSGDTEVEPWRSLSHDLGGRPTAPLSAESSLRSTTPLRAEPEGRSTVGLRVESSVRPTVGLHAESDVRPTVGLRVESAAGPTVGLLAELDARPTFSARAESDVRSTVPLRAESVVRPEIAARVDTPAHPATEPASHMLGAAPMLVLPTAISPSRRWPWAVLLVIIAGAATAALLVMKPGDNAIGAAPAEHVVASADEPTSVPVAAPPPALPAEAPVQAPPGVEPVADVAAPPAERPVERPVEPRVERPAPGSRPRPTSTQPRPAAKPTAAVVPPPPVAKPAQVPPPVATAVPTSGTLAVSSTRGGVVIVDGTRGKSTPFQTQLGTGDHDIVIELSEGAGTLRARARIEAGKKTKCKADSEKLTCVVSP